MASKEPWYRRYYGVDKEEILLVKDPDFPLPPTVTTLLQIRSLEGSILLWGLTNADFIKECLELLHTRNYLQNAIRVNERR